MDAYTKELFLAAQRIGEGEQALRWLIRFCTTDSAALSPGQLQDLRAEVAVFSLYGTRCSTMHMPTETEARAWHPSVSELCNLQTDVMKWLEDVPFDLNIEFRPGTSLAFNLSFRRTSRRASLYALGDSPVDKFKFNTILLLYLNAAELSRCEECKNVFVETRRRQRFCSLRCLRRLSQRSFQRKYRKQKKVKALKAK
jgi:hypothetical protein